MTISTQWIKIAVNGEQYQGYLALPPTGKGPGILLLQEIFGVNNHIRSVAEQYAQDGYVVLAPDIFWRTQSRVELGYEGADCDKAFTLMQKTDIPTTVNDLVAATQALRALPAVTGKMAVIGYCFGGQLAYRLAARAADAGIAAAVAYYGGGIENALEQANKIEVPILFHYGEQDAHIPLSVVDQVKARFAGRNNAQFHIYPAAEHGFNCWDRRSYQQYAAALARGRTLIFLTENLSTHPIERG